MSIAVKPLCFVLMPFGTKPDANNRPIHFDAVYEAIIKPAVTDAGMECVRADEEKVGGIIHKPMFERLLVCDFAIADLTMANTNVYYELGVRHALRPHTTLLAAAKGSGLPFDLGPVRVQCRYTLDEHGNPALPEEDATELKNSLAARQGAKDSPVYEFLAALEQPKWDQKALSEAFKTWLDRAAELRQRLSDAQRQGPDALAEFERELGDPQQLEASVARDLLLAYRAVKAWTLMIQLYERLPLEVKRRPQLRQQNALALNRDGRHQEAAQVLEALIDEIGPDGETSGILGRVHKDRWEQAARAGRRAAAAGHLDKAIETYLRGFEADWRSHYPGINAVELMTVRDASDPEITRLLPVVRYSAERAAASSSAEYWDYATLVEVAVLAEDATTAKRWLGRALAANPQPMELETTLQSLDRVLNVKRDAAVDVSELEQVVDELRQHGGEDGTPGPTASPSRGRSEPPGPRG
jgi:tetratricopeptide (TPR) repeat protein